MLGGVTDDDSAAAPSRIRRKIEHDIAEDQARLFDISLDLLCVAGVDGWLKRVSRSWTTTLGWTEDELLSRPSIEFVHPDDRAATIEARRGLTNGKILDALSNRYLCKGGGHRWIDWRSVPALDRGLIYCVARDVTAQRAAQEAHEKLQKQLMLADRMVSVGTLAAGIAHEINNPLSYVIANLETMAEELRHPRAETGGSIGDLEAMLRDARDGAERVHKIVRGLRTFSRHDEEKRVVMDVRPAVETAISMAWNEIKHRARLVKEFGPTPPIEADEARFGQVLVNLLVNAAHAIAEGHAETNEIRIATSTDDTGRAVVSVTDTGCGMSEELLARIFEPFFTTKPVGVGTGLGLSICHNIVTALGGTISARSEVGSGTTMRLELPPAMRAVASATGTSAPPATEHKKATVLVVDDEPAIGLALQRVLRGHDVTVLGNAQQALDLLAAGRTYDVIFSDLMMPQMTGQELHAEILRHWPDHAERLVFITGGAFTTAAQEFLERVPNERIMKPFRPESVRAAVRKVTAASGATTDAGASLLR